MPASRQQQTEKPRLPLADDGPSSEPVPVPTQAAEPVELPTFDESQVASCKERLHITNVESSMANPAVGDREQRCIGGQLKEESTLGHKGFRHRIQRRLWVGQMLKDVNA